MQQCTHLLTRQWKDDHAGEKNLLLHIVAFHVHFPLLNTD